MNRSQDNTILSGACLKDQAKGALEGNYKKIILAGITVSAITVACQFVLSIAEALISAVCIILYETLKNGIPLAQLEQMISDGTYMNPYQDLFSAIDYCLQIILNIFVTVFHIGMSLFCLNMACGRTFRISDVFYGFRHDFGKSLKLTSLIVLVSQICDLPLNILLYLVERRASSELILGASAFLAICVAVYIPISLSLSQIFLLTLDFPIYSAGEIIKLSTRIMSGHKSRLFYIRLSFLPLILLSLLSLGIGNLWLMPYMNLTYTLFFLNLMQARDRGATS